ncbi:MAG: LytTR family transcriptional regulator DNA-binding domain-containing protein [Ruminococcus sp.]|nr:LytTR family transcriptional regulator DNA-binding domain-containing protein [Ruminococcus sp.]MBQ9515414.1 LytTR family transcriptional regulator DNA-binding domain-containing protein [Ruminococcus sp.]
MFKITIEQIPRDREEEIVVRCHELSDEVSAVINSLRRSDTVLLGTKNGETFRVPLRDVYYIESVDNKTFLCLEKNVYETRKKLYELEELTLGTKLFRCSKAMILNIGKIRSVSASVNGRFEAKLLNGETVIISRQYVPALKEKLGM